MRDGITVNGNDKLHQHLIIDKRDGKGRTEGGRLRQTEALVARNAKNNKDSRNVALQATRGQHQQDRPEQDDDGEKTTIKVRGEIRILGV